MGFLKSLGGEEAGGGNFLSNMLGTSPERMHSIANRIGMGANQIAEAGGAQAGYAPQGYQSQNDGLNNFMSRLLGRNRLGLSANVTGASPIGQSMQPGFIPQRDLSMYGIGN